MSIVALVASLPGGPVRSPETRDHHWNEYLAQVWIWYFDTQPEMTSQSRFAKNASM